MTTKNDGGPAFPATGEHGLNSGMPGMTLRDHFAGIALAAQVNTTWHDLGFKAVNGKTFMENAAICAYQQADAMIKARGL